MTGLFTGLVHSCPVSSQPQAQTSAVSAIAPNLGRPGWNTTTIALAVRAAANVTRWMPPTVASAASGVSLCA